MDDSIFTALLQNLHPVSVLSFPEDRAPLQELSEKYCYHPVLQACFSEERLTETVRTLPGNRILEVQDAIGIRILLLRLNKKIWLVGPFVSQTFRENNVNAALALHGIPGSYIPSLKLYYSAFPLVSDQEVVHTLTALCTVLYPEEGAFIFQYAALQPADAKENRNPSGYHARFDYQSIRKRYELENRFLRMIEEGDTEHVIEAFDRMGIAELNNRRYLNAAYSRPEVSMAMIRALSRKAAERGGAPLTEINEITQRSVQAAAATSSERQILRNLHTMIEDLTQAVRAHRESEGGYSPQIRKAVLFLKSNYSQSVSLDETAEAAGFAPSYLSRRFKEEVGMTVSSYLRKLRCKHAAKLLKETDLPVSEIAFYVGYPDNNYFTKAFRKEYGMTPGAWRREENREAALTERI